VGEERTEATRTEIALSGLAKGFARARRPNIAGELRVRVGERDLGKGEEAGVAFKGGGLQREIRQIVRKEKKKKERTPNSEQAQLDDHPPASVSSMANPRRCCHAS
jgi:hypothetical protein